MNDNVYESIRNNNTKSSLDFIVTVIGINNQFFTSYYLKKFLNLETRLKAIGSPF